jgi:hypothetical protein
MSAIDRVRKDFMRCYFMKGGRIAAVELLSETSDEGRIREAGRLFVVKGLPRGAEGFEVWDRDRFVYRYPEEDA